MLKVLAVLVFLIILVAGLYLYWRHVFFYRDPEKTIPEGRNIVSPADGGTFGGPIGGGVVYAREFHDGKIPSSVKKGNIVDISKVLKNKQEWIKDGWLVGIFMSPFDVHTQRAPIAGTIETVYHWQNENALLAPMWWQLFIDRLLGREPDYFPKYHHILENERMVIIIRGRDFPGRVAVILIADQTVNQLTSLVKEGDAVEKGQRLANIGFEGSQVDIIIPKVPGLKVLVKSGDCVTAGETILATY